MMLPEQRSSLRVGWPDDIAGRGRKSNEVFDVIANWVKKNIPKPRGAPSSPPGQGKKGK
jgi:hypothetical protein